MKSAILRVVLALALCAATGDHLFADAATGGIYGRVTAKTTGQPLAYTNVIIVATTMGAMSLADGAFTITGVDAAKSALGDDRYGDRAELIDLATACKSLTPVLATDR